MHTCVVTRTYAHTAHARAHARTHARSHTRSLVPHFDVGMHAWRAHTPTLLHTRAMAGQAALLFSRLSSEDYMYAVLFLLHAYKLEIYAV